MSGHNRSMEWLVMQYLDQRLPERQRPLVEAHLTACDRCREYLHSSRTATRWLQQTSSLAVRDLAFATVWNGVRRRRQESSSAGGDWFRRWGWQWGWPARAGWLTAGGLAAAMLLLLVNPFTRLPVAQSHDAYVAFIEATDYPVMVLPPAQRGDMTVIWLFETVDAEEDTSPLPM